MAAWRVLVQQDRLDDAARIDFDPHLYFITRRPRIILDPASVEFTKDKVRGRFKIQRKESYEDIVFETNNYMRTDKIKAICDYPQTEYKFIDETGKIISEGKTALLLANTGSQYWKYLDLEVLYIGQAYGGDGQRTAIDRLKSHSTLQNIYAEAIRLSPDQDIWLFLCSFELIMIGSFDPRHGFEATLEEDTAHIAKVFQKPISEQQQINFTEAALIRYFQPEYNIIYKDTFPSPAHSTYAECYDIDLNMVSVEIQTDELGFRLWSPIIEPQWIHLFNYPLHSREDRKHMFDLL